MRKDWCLICERIEMIKEDVNPYFVAELETGYVVIADYQYYKGYSIFLCKQHVRELHELEENFKTKFLLDMSIVAEAVYKCFKPIKLNIELLGNADPHVHWHIVPRYGTDPFPNEPAWLVDKKILRSDESKPTKEELSTLKYQLLDELRKLTSNIVKAC